MLFLLSKQLIIFLIHNQFREGHFWNYSPIISFISEIRYFIRRKGVVLSKFKLNYPSVTRFHKH